jgi:hypothetical protein
MKVGNMADGKLLPVAIAVAGVTVLCIIIYACLMGGMGFCEEGGSGSTGYVEETDVEGVLLVKEARVWNQGGNITFTVDEEWKGMRIDAFPMRSEGTLTLYSEDGIQRATLLIHKDSVATGTVINLDPGVFYGQVEGEWTMVLDVSGGSMQIMVFEIIDEPWGPGIE